MSHPIIRIYGIQYLNFSTAANEKFITSLNIVHVAQLYFAFKQIGEGFYYHLVKIIAILKQVLKVLCIFPLLIDIEIVTSVHWISLYHMEVLFIVTTHLFSKPFQIMHSLDNVEWWADIIISAIFHHKFDKLIIFHHVLLYILVELSNRL